jgi:hypothetical protein
MPALPRSSFQVHQQVAIRNWAMIALADVQQAQHPRGTIGIAVLRCRD